MPIQTKRLLLKPRELGEGAAIAEAIQESLPELSPWMPFAQNPPSAEQAEIQVRQHMAEYLLRTSCPLSIYTPDGKTFVGSTGFHRINWEVRRFEIGYWIRTSFAGKGLVTEAVNAQTRYLFRQLGANRVEIRCDAQNKASLAVIRKLAFGTEAVFKNDDVDSGGALRDTLVAARYGIDGLAEVEGLEW
jgi:RimJ/RimL family protein N-acetyltransferase